MFAKLFSRRWLQFRLRTLLLLTFAVAIACRLVPFTHEEHWPDGSLKARYQVYRTWDGTLVAAGEQCEFYASSGLPDRRWVQYGGPPGAMCNGKHCTHWQEDGRQFSGSALDNHLIWRIRDAHIVGHWLDSDDDNLLFTSYPDGCPTMDLGQIPSPDEVAADIPEPEDPFGK